MNNLKLRTKQGKTFINVFCDLYSQKPIGKISIQEIAKQVGYNRSTFYQYFTDIYELLDYVEERVLNPLRRKWQAESFLHIIFKMHFNAWKMQRKFQF